MDTGVSNELQQGCPLPAHPPGQIAWSNVTSPTENTERDTGSQLRLYYNTLSDGNHSTTTPSPFSSSQEIPPSMLTYRADSERYQQQNTSLPPRMNQPDHFQTITMWSGHSSQVQPQFLSEHARPNGQTNSSNAFSYQPAGKNTATSWLPPTYLSYPAYSNDGGHRKKPYNPPEGPVPVAQSEPHTLQASNGSGLPQNHHMPMPPTAQYTHNGLQSTDGRTGNVLNRGMRNPVNMATPEHSVYPTMPSASSTNYYVPQTPHTPRHPNTMQFSHPMGPNHHAASPNNMNAQAQGHGRGKNRTNKSYKCPKCIKVFRRGDHLKRHLLSVHDHEHPYQCGDCGKGFASVAALLKHAKSLHVGNLMKGLMCLRCQLTFMSTKEIESHANSLHIQEDETYMQTINTSSKQHSCISCSKTFTSSAHLKRHMQLNHRSKDDSKNFCRECGKSFARIDALRKHVDKTHSGNPKALPPDDLDDADTTRLSTFSEGDSRGPSADNDESSSQSSAGPQWAPRPSSQPIHDPARPCNTISNSPIVPSSVIYQQVPGPQPQLNPDMKGRNVMASPGIRLPMPPMNVPQHSLPVPPNKESDANISQNVSVPRAHNKNDVELKMEVTSTEKNFAHTSNSDIVRSIPEQTVSEVFSMAMRTLSEFDYESPEELVPRSLAATPPLTNLHPNRNGFLPGNRYATNGVMPENILLGIIPPVLQPEMQLLNSNKYQVSSRPQHNFLMTMPPPPDATMGYRPTRLDMPPGMVQMPHQLSLFHQGGGGGVKVPIVNVEKSPSLSIVNQTTMQPKKNLEDRNVDKIISVLQKGASSKNNTAQGLIESNQEKIDLSCVICKTQYASIDELMTHVEGVHLKANPHECCICNKHFAQAGNVKRHIRFVHLRERPFRCKDCSCTFDRLCYLQRHMRTHLRWNEENQEFNPLKPCFCPECGKRCLTAHHLRGHMQRKHFAKNKQNYSEFLAKYGHLEALGNGPGAIVSQRGKRGRKKKNANAASNVKNCIAARNNISGTSLKSSSNSNSSSIVQPLYGHINCQYPPQLANNKNLQTNLPPYHKPQHTLQSNILQPAQHRFASYSHNVPGQYLAANHPTANPKTPGIYNFSVQQQNFAQNSETRPLLPHNHPQCHGAGGTTGDTVFEQKAKRNEEIIRRRASTSKPRNNLLSFRCSYCVVKYFYSWEMLRSHIAVHHKNLLKRHICCKCGASFAKHTNLVTHKTKFHENTCLLSKMKPFTNDVGRFSADINSLRIESPTILSSKLYSMHQQNQRSFNSVATHMNFFTYDPNSPAMVPSPNVDTMYRNPSHHINTSMPLIQT